MVKNRQDKKSVIERSNYIRDRTEDFDDYWPYGKKSDCNLTILTQQHLYAKGKLYLFDLVIRAMKEISIFIRAENLPKVTEILNKHNVGGFAFYEVQARGRTKINEVHEVVHAYMTGRKFTPEHEKRTKVETIVPDSLANQIIEDLVKIRAGPEGQGMIFVKEAVNAHEIGTSQSGEAILTGKN